MSRLEVIAGPMFSGKSEELLRRISREKIAGRKVVLFKPAIDVRYDSSKISSHNGTSATAINITYSSEIMAYGREMQWADVVGIDEAQFLDHSLEYIVNDLLENKNKKIIVAGLDKDFAMQDFGPMPRLMVLADRVDKLTAVCNKCGSDDASFTQRLIDNKPAAFDGPTILVGGTESYEARCRDCFEKG